MKEFWTYTGLRFLTLLATFGIVAGIWHLVAGGVNFFFAVIVAFMVSGIMAYFVLDPWRRQLAARVEERAGRTIEAMRSKEDVEIDGQEPRPADK